MKKQRASGRQTCFPDTSPEPARKEVWIRATLTLLGAVSMLAAGTGCASRHPASASNAPKESAKLISVGGLEGVELAPDSVKLAGVTTVIAGSQELHPVVEPTGQIAATDSASVQVTSRLPGRVVQALVGQGQMVEKGQLIATVDSVDLAQAEAAYQTALSHLRLTAQQLQQQRQLAGYGALSEQPVEDARRALAAAQAAAGSDAAQISVDKTALENTRQLVAMGEVTHKPVEDAQNAYAQAHSALVQARVNEHSTRANLDRAQVLFAGGVFAKQQLEDAETAYNSATAAVQQDVIQENLASDELARQERIYRQNLNGASSLQAAQTKLQQDQHIYANDLTALGLSRTQLARAIAVRHSGIPISQALQQAEDAYEEARVALQGTESTLRLYGVPPGEGVAQLTSGHALIPVVAPIGGIVATRSMAAGQLIDTTTPLVKIVNLDQVYVEAQVFENQLGSITPGAPVEVHVGAFPDREFTGRIQTIGSEVSPDTRTLTVRTVIANPGWVLRPGMYASVLIGGRAAKNSVAIPADAVLQEGQSQVVYVQVAPREFVRHGVQTGPGVGSEVAVLSGISPGDHVVVTGAVLIENEQQNLESEKESAE